MPSSSRREAERAYEAHEALIRTRPPRGFDDYVRWYVEVLDALGLPRGGLRGHLVRRVHRGLTAVHA